MSKLVGALALGGAAAAVYYLWTETQRQQDEAERARAAQFYQANMQAEQAKQARKAAILNPGGGGSANPWAPLLEWGIGEIVNGVRSAPRGGGLGGFLDKVFGGKGGGKGGGASSPPAQRQSAPVARPASSGGRPIGDRLMNDLQRDFGLSRTQAAGVVGNLDHESAGFDTLQEINPVVKGSRGGFGYAMWTGPRRREFEAWANGRGLDPTSYDANYGFLKHEMTNTWEKRVVPRLKNTSTVEQSTKVFQDTFLRPGIPHAQSRLDRARGYL
ncbi:hypothetical protein KBY28_07780 [Ruegeria pomeroyi]|uniref:phage tail tip lysozyme n=1 Tax=Ruegeria pomeroyi TaxID=89184 RepID=UPI001F3EFDEB|nr:phage tail tip lysozyme [Ruegeria pomeroyi]MCE8508349.1 hypothetical protein [Ruegeria pomeroyi]